MQDVLVQKLNIAKRAIKETPEADKAKKLSGGEIVIKSLLNEGVDTVFGYPGGVVLGLYDKLFEHPELKHILIRHEQGGTHAADGYARATGKPGVVLATSGPGATNTVTGIATSFMDSIPIVVITGQVTSSAIGYDAFQEADIIGITRPITKHSYLVRSADELGEIIHEAFYVATTGKPGPVVVDIPKDVVLGEGLYKGKKRKRLRGFNPLTFNNFENVDAAIKLIRKAKKPVIYAGGGAVSANASKELRDFAIKSNIPVTTTLLGLGAFPESHELSLGMLGMHGTWYANTAVDQCDLLIAVGARFDDRVTGRLSAFSQNSKKIHIDIDPSCIGKNVKVDVPIIADVKKALVKLTEKVEKKNIGAWLQTIAQWRKEHPLKYDEREDVIMPQHMIKKISEFTKGEAVVVTDVGQHQMWTAQYYNFNHPRSHLTSGGLGTMGYALPASMGAALGCKDRLVFCIAGDAGFQMTSHELATAVHHKLPIKIAIMNNGFLGMVRQWQEMFFEGRYSHSDLRDSNPDFVALAKSYGAVGLRATTNAELDDVLREALETNDQPVVMEICVREEENCFPMIPAGGAPSEMVEE